MTQNPNKKDSKTAELAKKGHKLTWIIKFKQYANSSELTRSCPVYYTSMLFSVFLILEY